MSGSKGKAHDALPATVFASYPTALLEQSSSKHVALSLILRRISLPDFYATVKKVIDDASIQQKNDENFVVVVLSLCCK